MSSHPGFNSNIRLGGVLYHVQTEVLTWEDSLFISTLIFYEGQIKYSVKTPYSGTSPAEIELQHSGIINKMTSGEIISDTEETPVSKRVLSLYRDDWRFQAPSPYTKTNEAIKSLITGKK